MFCYQCEETSKGKGCTIKGVCGKTEELSKIQDLLIYETKMLAYISNEGRKVGVICNDIDKYITENLFATITNVNFDENVFSIRVKETLKLRKQLKNKVLKNGGKSAEIKGNKVGVLSTKNEDIRSLRELIIYGIKGLAAYMKHAMNLGYNDEKIHGFIAKALSTTLDDLISLEKLVALALETGEYGVKAMALLDRANTDTYGNPELTKVNIGVGKRPGILISGHDLKDLYMLLNQTKDKEIDVYTHGEMLPAHYYPAFKKYSHFIGNYGNAWWKQGEEFDKFNGAILMTTNCVTIPKECYKDRLFTTGETGISGCTHILEDENGNKDFSKLIHRAKQCEPPTEIETGEIVGGFAHNQVLRLADKIVEAVKKGYIKRFFVMAGCDGRAKSREYYTEFAKKLPKDTVILTAGCAKYKYNKLELGDILGIPRVLDAGQCNDSYSLVVIALKLQEIFGLDDINKLPISYNIAWYEQKAVIVLLALLHLGVKNIHLGPTLPAFLSQNVVKVLVDNFGISGISSVYEDIKMFLN